jgi:preprotein translocase subunit SecA
MGTNRHESSRIDQQLRGRAGRQGDTGSSRFFLSFEDDMFVVFGGDGLKKILSMFRVSDDMPVEAPQVTDALDKVQGTVEEKYRNIRREVFNFDEVLNGQRRVIYARRRDMLFTSPEESLAMMKKYNKQTVADIIKAQTSKDGTINVDKVLEKIGLFFPPVAPLVRKEDIAGLDRENLTNFLTVAADEVFSKRVAELDEKARAAGKESSSLGRSANYITLITMDNAWSDHLQSMENLKESVILRQYEGRDPVSEYENESFTLFKGLEDTMRFNAVYSLWQSAFADTPVTQAA